MQIINLIHEDSSYRHKSEDIYKSYIECLPTMCKTFGLDVVAELTIKIVEEPKFGYAACFWAPSQNPQQDGACIWINMPYLIDGYIDEATTLQALAESHSSVTKESADLFVLAHELWHYRQFLDQVVRICNKSIVWKGKRYSRKTRPKLEQYNVLPWEVDANRQAGRLMRKFKALFRERKQNNAFVVKMFLRVPTFAFDAKLSEQARVNLETWSTELAKERTA